MKAIVAHFLLICSLHAQGPLAPTGGPGPTQKSLQEIWDKLQSVESTVSLQRQQISLLQQQNTILLESLQVSLPWHVVRVGDATLPSSGYIDDIAKTSLAFLPDGNPVIAFYDANGGDLKFAVRDGGDWTVTTIDSGGDVGHACSMAISPTGLPAISYYDVTNQDLKFATFSGTSWAITTVDALGNVGGSSSLAFSPEGNPSIAYDDDTTEEINYAVLIGGAWQITHGVTDGSEGSMAFAPSGRPAIAYTSYDHTHVGYVAFDGSIWDNLVIDEQPEEGFEEWANAFLAFSPTGEPAITYDYWDGAGQVLIANRTNGNWTKSNIVADAYDWGFGAVLCFAPDGRPAVAYTTDPYNDPYPVSYDKFDGTTWKSNYVPAPGDHHNRGYFPSLAFDPGGQPSVAFYQSGGLYFATRGPYQP